MRETPSPQSRLVDERSDILRGGDQDPLGEALEHAEREAAAREVVVREMAAQMRRQNEQADGCF